MPTIHYIKHEDEYIMLHGGAIG